MMDYKTASPDRYKLLKEFALENRKNQTLAEHILWQSIKAEKLEMKVLRQNLAIEVDGAYHAERQQTENDEIRDSILNNMGYRVIRFTNEEVLYNIEETLETIIKEIDSYE